MIVGIGVDIAETDRVRRLAEKYGQRFARRILTDDELVEFERRHRPIKYLVSRYAAKEAVAKALGTGIGGQFGFHSVQIDRNGQGKPVLRFLGDAIELVAGMNVTSSLISLSDEKHYAVAMVVLES
jgi:holo-[acyl-carrier protein] synthase